MPDVIADPEEIEKFAGQLNRVAEELKRQAAQLTAGYNRLSTTWRDSRYRRFANDFDNSMKDVRRAVEALSPYPRQLRADAQQLRAYLRGRR